MIFLMQGQVGEICQDDIFRKHACFSLAESHTERLASEDEEGDSNYFGRCLLSNLAAKLGVSMAILKHNFYGLNEQESFYTYCLGLTVPLRSFCIVVWNFVIGADNRYN